MKSFFHTAANVLRFTDKVLHRILLTIAQLAIVAMVAIVTYTVVLRYVFNSGLGWAEEVPRLLVGLFAMIACAIGVRDHLHVAVSILFNRLKIGGPAQKALIILTDVCILACGFFMCYYGSDRVLRMMKLPGKMPMTGLPNWVQYSPIPIAGGMMMFDSILFIFGILKQDDTLYEEKIEEVKA